MHHRIFTEVIAQNHRSAAWIAAVHGLQARFEPARVIQLLECRLDGTMYVVGTVEQLGQPSEELTLQVLANLALGIRNFGVEPVDIRCAERVGQRLGRDDAAIEVGAERRQFRCERLG